jgi:hypothetical protein
VRADNNDSAGGPNGCDIDADPDPCAYGSYFWGNNNACQRNLTYVPVQAAKSARIQFPFIVGSLSSKSRFIQVIVEKPRELAETPMRLTMETLSAPDAKPACPPGELVFTGKCHVTVRAGGCDIGEIVTAPGMVWRPHYPTSAEEQTGHGAQKADEGWTLLKPISSVAFGLAKGELCRMRLSFTAPATLPAGSRPLIRIFQRNDKKTITGGVQLQLQVGEFKPARRARRAPAAVPERPRRAKRSRRTGRSRRA